MHEDLDDILMNLPSVLNPDKNTSCGIPVSYPTLTMGKDPADASIINGLKVFISNESSHIFELEPLWNFAKSSSDYIIKTKCTKSGQTLSMLIAYDDILQSAGQIAIEKIQEWLKRNKLDNKTNTSLRDDYKNEIGLYLISEMDAQCTQKNSRVEFLEGWDRPDSISFQISIPVNAQFVRTVITFNFAEQWFPWKHKAKEEIIKYLEFNKMRKWDFSGLQNLNNSPVNSGAFKVTSGNTTPLTGTMTTSSGPLTWR